MKLCMEESRHMSNSSGNLRFEIKFLLRFPGSENFSGSSRNGAQNSKQIN